MKEPKWINAPQGDWLNKLAEKRIQAKPNNNTRTGPWYSENGEDGVIEYLFTHIEDTNKFALDLGAGGGYVGSNLRHMVDVKKWSTTEIDGKKYPIQSPTVQIERITPDNVVGLLEKYNTPQYVDLMSLDIDSMDYQVLESVLLAGYSSTVLAIEYNPIFSSSESYYRNYDASYNKDSTSNYGASIACFQKILDEYGYTLIHVFGQKCPVNGKTIQSNNALFIKDEYIIDPVTSIHDMHKETWIESWKSKNPNSGLESIKANLISNTFTEL